MDLVSCNSSRLIPPSNARGSSSSAAGAIVGKAKTVTLILQCVHRGFKRSTTTEVLNTVIMIISWSVVICERRAGSIGVYTVHIGYDITVAR